MQYILSEEEMKQLTPMTEYRRVMTAWESKDDCLEDLRAAVDILEPPQRGLVLNEYARRRKARRKPESPSLGDGKTALAELRKAGLNAWDSVPDPAALLGRGEP